MYYNGELVYKIGHEVKSETTAPKFYPMTPDKSGSIYLVDGPGINDSNLKKEYANQTGIKYILNNCN